MKLRPIAEGTNPIDGNEFAACWALLANSSVAKVTHAAIRCCSDIFDHIDCLGVPGGTHYYGHECECDRQDWSHEHDLAVLNVKRSFDLLD